MADIQPATAEIRRGKMKKKKERKKQTKKNYRTKIQWSALFRRAIIKSAMTKVNSGHSAPKSGMAMAIVAIPVTPPMSATHLVVTCQLMSIKI